jgi:hypothetical protein
MVGPDGVGRVVVLSFGSFKVKSVRTSPNTQGDIE